MLKTTLKHRDGRTVTTPHTINIHETDESTLKVRFKLPDENRIATETYDALDWDIVSAKIEYNTGDKNNKTSTLTPYNSSSPTWCVTDGTHTHGPYESHDRAERRKARFENESENDWTIHDTVSVLQEPEIPFPTDENDTETKHIVNYQDIREGLDLILERMCPDNRDKIKNMLDDAVTNNADQLLVKTDIQ